MASTKTFSPRDRRRNSSSKSRAEDSSCATHGPRWSARSPRRPKLYAVSFPSFRACNTNWGCSDAIERSNALRSAPKISLSRSSISPVTGLALTGAWRKGVCCNCQRSISYSQTNPSFSYKGWPCGVASSFMVGTRTPGQMFDRYFQQSCSDPLAAPCGIHKNHSDPCEPGFIGNCCYGSNHLPLSVRHKAPLGTRSQESFPITARLIPSRNFLQPHPGGNVVRSHDSEMKIHSASSWPPQPSFYMAPEGLKGLRILWVGCDFYSAYDLFPCISPIIIIIHNDSGAQSLRASLLVTSVTVAPNSPQAPSTGDHGSYKGWFEPAAATELSA